MTNDPKTDGVRLLALADECDELARNCRYETPFRRVLLDCSKALRSAPARCDEPVAWRVYKTKPDRRVSWQELTASYTVAQQRKADGYFVDPLYAAPRSHSDAGSDYVLMPREATRAMTMAGCDSLPACEHVFGYASEMLRNAYRKMVEVAALSPSSNGKPATESKE